MLSMTTKFDFLNSCSAMPRQLAPSYALLTAVRTHFALTQAELARYLGISSEHLFSVEKGRRRLGSATERRLAPLLDHLPPPVSGGRPLPAPETLPALPPPALSPAEATRLRARLDRCRRVAQELAQELAQAERAAAAHQRRRQGLAALRTALLPTPADTPNPIPPSPFADPAHDAAWLARLEEGTAAQRLPAPAALAHLALRQRLLLEEAAGLAALLGEQASPSSPA